MTVKTGRAQQPVTLDARIVRATALDLPEQERPAALTQGSTPMKAMQPSQPNDAAGREILDKGNILTAPVHYFRQDEIDVSAEPISKPSLIFPERAFMSRLSGKVRARLFINEKGNVDGLEIIETIPQHQPFTDSAIEALKATVFAPALMSGRRVKSQKLVDVIFNAQEDAIAEPEPPSRW